VGDAFDCFACLQAPGAGGVRCRFDGDFRSHRRRRMRPGLLRRTRDRAHGARRFDRRLRDRRHAFHRTGGRDVPGARAVGHSLFRGRGPDRRELWQRSRAPS
jgi:hypothetical protein